MSIFNIDIGERIVHQLTRIADALDRAVPPITLPRTPAGEPDAEIVNSSNEDLIKWEKQAEAERQGHPEKED